MARRLALLPLALALLVLSPRPARADGLYFTEAFGGSKIRNELGGFVDGAAHVHAGLGFRARNTSVEGWFGVDIDSDLDTFGEVSPLTYGLDLKHAFRVTGRLEAYVRGSVSRMQISDGVLAGYGGRGLGVGTGLQVKGKAPALALLYPPIALVCLIPGVCKSMGPMATVALYVDQGYDFYRLHDEDRSSIDAEATRWRVGFAVGMDF
jgi:hypothetical protein